MQAFTSRTIALNRKHPDARSSLVLALPFNQPEPAGPRDLTGRGSKYVFTGGLPITAFANQRCGVGVSMTGVITQCLVGRSEQIIPASEGWSSVCTITPRSSTTFEPILRHNGGLWGLYSSDIRILNEAGTTASGGKSVTLGQQNTIGVRYIGGSGGNFQVFLNGAWGAVLTGPAQAYTAQATTVGSAGAKV